MLTLLKCNMVAFIHVIAITEEEILRVWVFLNNCNGSVLSSIAIPSSAIVIFYRRETSKLSAFFGILM